MTKKLCLSFLLVTATVCSVAISRADQPGILLIVSEDNGPELGDYTRFAKEFINASGDPFFLSVNDPDAHKPWITQVDGLPADPQTRDEVRVMDYMGIESPEFCERVADHYNCMSRLDSLVGDLLHVLDRSEEPTTRSSSTSVITGQTCCAASGRATKVACAFRC